MRKWGVLLLSLIPMGVLLIFLPFIWSTPLDQVAVTIGTFFTFCPLGYIMGFFLGFLLRHFHFEPSGPASDDELLREDEVLMEATAFLQGIIFIYLNLIPSDTDSLATTFRWSVPVFGVLFYLLRAYARIRLSGKFRYYSIYVFSLMIFFDISAFMTSYAPQFYIADVDILHTLLSLIPVWIFTFLQVTLGEQAKARYGISKTSKST